MAIKCTMHLLQKKMKSLLSFLLLKIELREASDHLRRGRLRPAVVPRLAPGHSFALALFCWFYQAKDANFRIARASGFKHIRDVRNLKLGF